MTDAHMPRLYLLQWLKSDRALMMLFNDGTFQVNTIIKKTAVAGHAQSNTVVVQCLCQYSGQQRKRETNGNIFTLISTGQFLSRPHKDHPVLPEGWVHAYVHQWGPCLQNLQTELLADVGLPHWPAWTHGVLPQHAPAEMQLNHYNNILWTVSNSQTSALFYCSAAVEQWFRRDLLKTDGPRMD